MFLVPGREPTRLDGVDVELMARVLALSALAISATALSAEADEAAIAALVDLGVLLEGTEAELTVPAVVRTPKRCKTLVVGLSGSVAVIHATRWLVELADHFADQVEVIVSEGAQQFVIPEVFGYHGMRVWTSMSEPAHGVAVPHSYLASAADLVLVAPASASMMHKLATGACSDLISLVVAATRAPVVIAPSTNAEMWQHPPVQRNVAQLRADGHWIIEPWRGGKIAKRDQLGVGILGFDVTGLVRALDVLMPPRSVG